MRQLFSVLSFFILLSAVTATAGPTSTPLPKPPPPPAPGPIPEPPPSTNPNVCIVVFSGYNTVTSSCDGDQATQLQVESWTGNPVILTQVESRELASYYTRGLHLISCTWLGQDATQCTLAK